MNYLSLDSLRRQAYFEWTKKEIERIGGSENALGLAKSQHLDKFLLVESGNDMRTARNMLATLRRHRPIGGFA